MAIMRLLAQYALNRAIEHQKDAWYLYVYHGPGSVGWARANLCWAVAKVWYDLALALLNEPKE